MPEPRGQGVIDGDQPADARWTMASRHVSRRLGAAAVILLLGLGSGATARAAAGTPARPAVQYCAQVPMVGGIPPWGFHTGAPITGASGSYARGHGDIDLDAGTVSGILCQVDRVPGEPDRMLTMTVQRRLVSHSHHAVLWGYPGNIMTIIVRVRATTDPRCAVRTLGRVTLFASYNGVRSDSVQFTFPGACSDHDHMYHGSEVDNQVPPL
jgi:hypothetical protein